MFNSLQQQNSKSNILDKYWDLYANASGWIKSPLAYKNFRYHRSPNKQRVLNNLVNPKEYWGCKWLDYAPYAAIDIDVTSKYHNEYEYTKISRLLSSVGIEHIRYMSSNSTGWHLVCPFSTPIPVREFYSTIEQLLKANHYTITGGQLEIFPSNQCLRLPFQATWAEMDHESIYKHFDLTMRLNRFMTHLEVSTVSWSKVKANIDKLLSRSVNNKPIVKLTNTTVSPNGRNIELWQKGQQYWLNGLTGKGQSHNARYSLSHYLWYGDSTNNVPQYGTNDDLRASVIYNWFLKHSNGYCQQINEYKFSELKADIIRHCKHRATNRKSLTWNDTCAQTQSEKLKLIRANLKRETLASQRISQCLASDLWTTKKLTLNALALESKSDKRTVRKVVYQLSSGGGHITGGMGNVLLTRATDLINKLNPQKTPNTSQIKSTPCEVPFKTKFKPNLRMGLLILRDSNYLLHLGNQFHKYKEVKNPTYRQQRSYHLLR